VTQNATALFGMPGFEVSSTEMIDGEWYVGIQTPRDWSAVVSAARSPG
jgi:hypothetical protein